MSPEPVTPVASLPPLPDAFPEHVSPDVEPFRVAFELDPIGRALTAPDGRWLQVNRRMCELLGYSRAELANISFLDITHPDDRGLSVALLERLVEGSTEAGTIEKRYIRKDGSVFWAETSTAAVRHPSGTLAYFVTAVQDLTARREAERELQASEQKHRLLFECAGDAIFILGAAGNMLAVNRVATERLGYTHAELMAIHVGAIDIPEEATRVSERMAASMRDAGATFETVHIRKDGTRVPTEVTTRPVDWDGQRAIIAICRDITARKDAERTAREEDERLRRISSLMSDVAYSCREHAPGSYAIDWMMGATERVIGYTLDEIMALRCWGSLVVDEDRPRFTRFVLGLAPGAHGSCELRLRHRDGRLVWVASHAERPGGPGLDGSVIYGGLVDITDRKQAEDEKARLQAQLEQAQKMESVGRLAGGVAHDFNNMLEVILGGVEMALEQVGPDAPLRGELVEIRTAAERSADLTRQLLAFARKQPVVPRLLDANRAVEETVALVRRLLGENVRLEWRPGAGPMAVRLDTAQLTQILTNLCVNAREAIADTGVIVIETAVVRLDAAAAHALGGRAGSYVRISVTDDGVGMDQATLAHVFEPFFTTRPVGKGTGLGLATVYGAVNQNDGLVDVRSAPGQGTTIAVYFPQAAGELADAPVDAPVGAPVRKGTSRATILIAEDEPSILSMTRRTLERCGYTVIAAATPAQAMAVARAHRGRIDLLLTDVIMPEMNGSELARELRAIHPEMKQIFTSGYPEHLIAVHGVLDERMYFLQKPFTLAALTAKVQQVLSGA